MWSPVGSQAIDQVALPIPGFGPVFLGSQTADQCMHLPGVFDLGPRPLIWVCANLASGVCWGCLSHIHSPGAEVVGVQEATAAAERSLKSPRVPVFSLFLFEKFFVFKPPWSRPAPGSSHSPAWLSPKNPAADPAPRPGASATLVPTLVPRTLLSLSTLLTV